MMSCQCSTGIWLVTMVEARPWRSSRSSRRSRRSGGLRTESPVVEDEELNATDGFEQAAIAAVASSEGERLEQARDAMILDRAIVAASFVTEGASNPAFLSPRQKLDCLRPRLNYRSVHYHRVPRLFPR